MSETTIESIFGKEYAKKVNQAADNAAATHKHIKSLNKDLLKAKNTVDKKLTQEKIEVAKRQWWQDNKHLFNKE